MTLRNLIIVYCVSVCCFCVNAQVTVWETAGKEELAEAYIKSSKWFINTPSYYFKLKYTSFKDHVTKEQIESSEGYYKRVENNFVSAGVGIKTTQNSKVKIVIDTSDKIITIMNPGNLSPNIAHRAELQDLLNSAKKIRKAKHQMGVKYRIDFNKNDLYEAYEFTISDGGIMTELIYYYSEQKEKSNDYGSYEKSLDKKIKPRLEITFFNYQIPAKFSNSEFIEEDIYIGGSGKVFLINRYKGYRLLDYRFQTTN